MSWHDDWSSIRSESPVEALANLAADFDSDQSDASTALDLVAAYMWLARYADAVRICDAARSVRDREMSVTCFPIQQGTAEWCLGNFAEAKLSWESTAGVKYADAAGANVHYLLLLAADGLVRGALPVSVREAMEKKRTDARVHHNWPGPIVLFLLGIYGASMVLANVDDRPVDRWQFNFYRALKTYALRRDFTALSDDIALLLSQVTMEADLDAFVDFARLPEVYLARMLLDGSHRERLSAQKSATE